MRYFVLFILLASSAGAQRITTETQTRGHYRVPARIEMTRPTTDTAQRRIDDFSQEGQRLVGQQLPETIRALQAKYLNEGKTDAEIKALIESEAVGAAATGLSIDIVARMNALRDELLKLAQMLQALEPVKEKEKEKGDEVQQRAVR